MKNETPCSLIFNWELREKKLSSRYLVALIGMLLIWTPLFWVTVDFKPKTYLKPETRNVYLLSGNATEMRQLDALIEYQAPIIESTGSHLYANSSEARKLGSIDWLNEKLTHKLKTYRRTAVSLKNLPLSLNQKTVALQLPTPSTLVFPSEANPPADASRPLPSKTDQPGLIVAKLSISTLNDGQLLDELTLYRGFEEEHLGRRARWLMVSGRPHQVISIVSKTGDDLPQSDKIQAHLQRWFKAANFLEPDTFELLVVDTSMIRLTP